MKTIEIDTYSDAEKIILAEQLWDSVSKENLTLSEEVKAELDSRLKNLEDKKQELSLLESQQKVNIEST